MKTNVLILATLFVPVFASAQTQSNELKQVRKIIEASNAIYAELANKNDGSILTRYTQDACLLPPNAGPVCGHADIANFFRSGPKVRVTFTIQALYGDAREYVTELSYYEMTDLNGAKMDEGKVLVVWKNTKDGWKMHRDMFSSNRPAK
ncbi:MAG TPA: ketosteroid isomerase family protein [Cyclobacteriaceae bacterium]|nr:ketosteroid isomerase family protein [Cyclobacteriaceae bacterium]